MPTRTDSTSVIVSRSFKPAVAAFRGPLNALFESMSGFTGTGLTMADDESALPRVLQWWRTFTEWVGGVGVNVITTASLSRPGSASLTLCEGITYRITGVFVPDAAVRRFELDGRVLDEAETDREFAEAASIAALWAVFLAAGTLVLRLVLPDGEFTLQNVVFEVASAQGNVGLSSGITGPGMPSLAKVAFLFNMWIGRLEIIPVLVFLRALFERGALYR